MKVMHEDDAREETLRYNDEIRLEKAMKNTLIPKTHLIVHSDTVKSSATTSIDMTMNITQTLLE